MWAMKNISKINQIMSSQREIKLQFSVDHLKNKGYYVSIKDFLTKIVSVRRIGKRT